jgi:hypothetical protein
MIKLGAPPASGRAEQLVEKYALFTPPCTPFGRLYPVDNQNIKDDISQTGTKRLASKIVRLGRPKIVGFSIPKTGF